MIYIIKSIERIRDVKIVGVVVEYDVEVVLAIVLRKDFRFANIFFLYWGFDCLFVFVGFFLLALKGFVALFLPFLLVVLILHRI